MKSTTTKLQRISWLSRRNPEMKFKGLMHHFNEGNLRDCFSSLNGKKATGVDGVTKEEYGQNLSDNIATLVGKMINFSHKPGPVLEVKIPKEGTKNSFRPLGISNFEDKIIQVMMGKVLEAVFEPIFYDFSYGFRPGRGCIDAVRKLRDHLFRSRTTAIIDVDLKNFFGSIPQETILSMVQEKVSDKKLLRYINRMLKAGILADGELKMSDEGVVQGSCCSPILANIVAHYVLDEWFANVVAKHCQGKIKVIRYADDLVVACENARDAQRILSVLPKRLARFGLELNSEKTKVVSFSRSAANKGRRQGTFSFLGFTFYLGKSAKGTLIPKVKTERKRLRAKLKRVKIWILRVRSMLKLPAIWKIFRAKLQGHLGYYGVSFNTVEVQRFFSMATRIVFKWLNRRSQRKSFTWDKFNKFLTANPLPKVRVVHRLY